MTLRILRRRTGDRRRPAGLQRSGVARSGRRAEPTLPEPHVPYVTEHTEPDGTRGVLLNIKAVPGAKRSEIAGVLGDRLKVRVAAPPEDGKANAAIAELLAKEFKVRTRDVEIIRGHSNPEKTVRVRGITVAQATKW